LAFIPGDKELLGMILLGQRKKGEGKRPKGNVMRVVRIFVHFLVSKEWKKKGRKEIIQARAGLGGGVNQIGRPLGTTSR